MPKVGALNSPVPPFISSLSLALVSAFFCPDKGPVHTPEVGVAVRAHANFERVEHPRRFFGIFGGAGEGRSR